MSQTSFLVIGTFLVAKLVIDTATEVFYVLYILNKIQIVSIFSAVDIVLLLPICIFCVSKFFNNALYFLYFSIVIEQFVLLYGN